MALPFRMFLGSDRPEPYWPQEGGFLAWVCDSCIRYTRFPENAIQWSTEIPALRADRGFWRIEIACSEPKCPSSITAHWQSFGMTSRRALGMAVASAKPTPQCEFHHGPAQAPYPRQLDFIEWTGSDGYLV